MSKSKALVGKAVADDLYPYTVEVKNKETQEWEVTNEGEAVSRRKFIESLGGRKTVQVSDGDRRYNTRSELTGRMKELIANRLQYRVRIAL